MLAIDSIVVMHHGSNKTANSLTVIVGLMNHMPDGVDNVAGYGDITLTGFDLEVANLSVESGWQLRHGKIGKESQTIDFNVAAEADGADDGAWTKEYDSARRDVTFHKVDVDMYLATNEDS